MQTENKQADKYISKLISDSNKCYEKAVSLRAHAGETQGDEEQWRTGGQAFLTRRLLVGT